MCVYMHTCNNVCVCICIYVIMYVCVYTCMYVCICICMCVYVYVNEWFYNIHWGHFLFSNITIHEYHECVNLWL